ncbi:QRFP-like peptide receptor, partial [Patella vulgata]|uniref:QRFP-like peptide receptor n=1 Tax=Patella vulgata TaxID=6465 RepID=UPI0024A84418
MLREDNSDGSSGRLMSRKQAAKMLIILVILFLICWLPYNIFSLCVDLTSTDAPTSGLPFALWLGHAHSAVNPVMYWVLNRRFRDRVKNLMNYIRRRSNHFQSTPTPEGANTRQTSADSNSCSCQA